jgi:cobalamin biosynthesis Mg chelatase CobN
MANDSKEEIKESKVQEGVETTDEKGKSEQLRKKEAKAKEAEEKAKEAEEKAKEAKKSIWLMTSVLVLGLIAGVVYMTTQKQVIEESTSIQIQEYNSLLNSWNEQVQNRTAKKKFLLSRDSNVKVIEQLNEWMKNFYIFDVTDSTEYNNFLESNKLEKLVVFNTIMSEDEVREKLKAVSKEKTMSSIVKKVLMMNDIEFWQKNKEEIK